MACDMWGRNENSFLTYGGNGVRHTGKRGRMGENGGEWGRMGEMGSYL